MNLHPEFIVPSIGGVITHPEPDILECKVKWVLGNITTKKASGGDGIPVELFQILKDDAVKVMHSICQQIWRTQQWQKDWKSFFSFHSNLKEGQCQRMFKLLHNCTHFTFWQSMLKILYARFQQQYVNHELPDTQAGFRKDRGTRNQIANIHWITEKARKTQKNIYSCFTDYAKASDCVDHNKLENS